MVACIIGDEVLSGKTLDTNSHHLAKLCFSHGLRLSEIRVIPDQVETIAQTVRSWIEDREIDLVVTSGGIGPTHDDLTYEAISQAAGVKLALDRETLSRMKGNEPNEGQIRMATLPSPSRILRVPDLWQPIALVAEKVAILPGVPSLFQKMSDYLFANLQSFKPNMVTCPVMRVQVRTMQRESLIAAPLRQLQSLHPQWQLGSYPHLAGDQSHVVLSIVGPVEDEAAIQQLAQEMCHLFAGSKL